MTVSWQTPPEMAKELRVHPDRVRRWIANGELGAVNLSDSDGRPRWRISSEAKQAFLTSRLNRKLEIKERRRQTRMQATEVTEFF